MIFEILHAIEPFGCTLVVGIILTIYNRKVVKISAFVFKKILDIIVELKDLVASSSV